jgi:hypothetical protein
MSDSAPSSIKDIGFPHISSMPRKLVTSSDHEEVRRIRAEYQRAWEADYKEYTELVNDWKMYFGWPGEQWDEDAIRYKEEHGQRAAQYNIIRPKLNIFHGSIVSDEYDFKYTPIDRRRTTAIKAVEDAYYCDKEECSYDYYYSLTILDGCIHVGVMEQVVTSKFDPRGNIAFVRRDPGRIVFDPYWTTDNDWDCLSAWKWGFVTVPMLKAMYQKLPSSPKLDEEIKHLKKMGMAWDELTMGDAMVPFPSRQHAYHIIDAHWLEEVRKKRIIARGADGRWVPFPVTDDNELLEQFAQRIGVEDWQNGAQVVPYTDRIHHQATVCWDLFPDKFLEYGKPEVQPNRLPYYQFTCSRDLSGRNMGLVGPLKDPQLDINYNKSKMQTLLAHSLGGAAVYDKTRIPDESDQQDFEQNRNDPERSFGLNGPVNGFMDHTSSAEVPQAVINQTAEAFDNSNQVVNVTPAMESMSQGSSEPASLYAMKLRQSKTGSRTVDDRVKYLREQMAVGYFEQARISYAGAERHFTSKDGKREAVFNVILPDGSILNKIDAIPRCSVSIEEAPNNLSRQLRDRSEVAAVLEAIPPEYREHISILIDKLIKTTALSQTMKGEIEEATEIERIKARVMSMTEIKKMLAESGMAEASIIQTQMQIDQLTTALQQRQQQQEQQLEPAVSSPEGGAMPQRGAPPLMDGGPASGGGGVTVPQIPEEFAPSGPGTPGEAGPVQAPLTEQLI